MASRLFAFGRLKSKERLAVDLLRGGRTDDAGDAAAFERLRMAATSAGLSTGPVGSNCVGPDEFIILALLTALQRQRPPPLPAFDVALLAVALDCARRLTARGSWLPYRLTTPLLAGAAGSLGADVRTGANHRSITAPAELPSGSPHDRALALVAARGTVSTGEFVESGVSSHVIRTMRHWGLLTRVRHGIYAGPRDARVLVSH